MRGTNPRGRQPILLSSLDRDCFRPAMLRAGCSCAVYEAQCLLQPFRSGGCGRYRIGRGAAPTPLLQSRAEQPRTCADLAECPGGGVCSDSILCRLPGLEVADGRDDGAGSHRQFRDQQHNDSACFSQAPDAVQVNLVLTSNDLCLRSFSLGKVKGKACGQFPRNSTASLVSTSTGWPFA